MGKIFSQSESEIDLSANILIITQIMQKRF
jgi:hypothetical protein